MFHERAWIRSDVYAIIVKCVVECRDAAHSKELEDTLRASYDFFIWGTGPSPKTSAQIDYTSSYVSSKNGHGNNDG